MERMHTPRIIVVPMYAAFAALEPTGSAGSSGAALVPVLVSAATVSAATGSAATGSDSTVSESTVIGSITDPLALAVLLSCPASAPLMFAVASGESAFAGSFASASSAAASASTSAASTSSATTVSAVSAASMASVSAAAAGPASPARVAAAAPAPAPTPRTDAPSSTQFRKESYPRSTPSTARCRVRCTTTRAPTCAPRSSSFIDLSAVMHTFALALALAAPCAAGEAWRAAFAAQPDPGARDLARRYFVVHAADAAAYAAAHEYTLEEPFPIEDHWLLSAPAGARLERRGASRVYADGLSRVERRAPRPAEDQALDMTAIGDPLFPAQWHLRNTQSSRDVNVAPVWARGITGKNVTVAIVDDGVDYDHPDFAESFSLEGSWDYNLHQQAPKPLLSIDTHGTRCAGEVAAGVNNACGVGVAPGAKVAGIRILSGALTVADEARALVHRYELNDIYSCSWGPSDDGKTIDGPPAIVRRAELAGVEEGRGGRGAVYVVASGNGFMHGDGCNYDGYTNSIYSVTVSAVDKNNLHPYYAESCSANMAVTYSSNYVDKITTSDRLNPLNPDEPVCTDQHSGTSAAAPLAAGILALVLEARPELTWRDVQYVVREAAQPFEISAPPDFGNLNAAAHHPESADWQITADGRKYHNYYGYGLMDAERLVDVAQSWQLVKPQSWLFTAEKVVNAAIGARLESTIAVGDEEWAAANLDRIEHVRVRVSYQHEYRGALTFKLRSPAGIESELAAQRLGDRSGEPVVDWEFMSVVHWGEQGLGEWTLIVLGDEALQGGLHSWQLKLFGEAKDPALAKRFSEVWDHYEPHEDVVDYARPEHDANEGDAASGDSGDSGDNGASDNSGENGDNGESGDNNGDSNGDGNDTSGQPDNGENAGEGEPSEDVSAGEDNGGGDSGDAADGGSETDPDDPYGGADSDNDSEPSNSDNNAEQPAGDNPDAGDSGDTGSGESGDDAADAKPVPKPPPHSVKYYVGATLFGMVLLSAFAGPVVYWYIKRRERAKRYVQLDDEYSGDFELNDYDEFEIEGSDVEEGLEHDEAGLIGGPRDGR